MDNFQKKLDAIYIYKKNKMNQINKDKLCKDTRRTSQQCDP